MLFTKTITAEEYLAFERASTEKHEFIFQTIIPMAGAKRVHNLIAVNLASIIWNYLHNSENEVYPSDMRVVNSINESYFYPDVSVSNGEAIIMDSDILTNPQLVIEVLSPSTAVFDKTDKFIAYRTIPSLKEYVLVSTDIPQIEIFRKNETENWTVETVNGLDKTADFNSISLKISLKDVYQRIFEQ